jgi:hypothetical protein
LDEIFYLSSDGANPSDFDDAKTVIVLDDAKPVICGNHQHVLAFIA